MPTYVIVGASRGMGLEYITQLSTNPSNTIIGLSRTPSTARTLPNVHLLPADLTSAASLTLAAAQTALLTPSIDYLILNGAWLGTATQQLTPSQHAGRESEFLAEVSAAFATNFAGPLFAINAFRDLVLRARGKVVLVSSGMADTEFVLSAGVPGALVYSASKAAANVLVAKVAVELKGEGVVVVGLSPGVVDTVGTVESKKQYEPLTQVFRNYEPGFEGPISKEESVGMQLDVTHGLGMKHSGRMWSHFGTQRWL